MIGLEFFVDDGLIKTVLEPTLNQIAVMAVIVAIITIVVYSLNKELKGIGPEEAAKEEKLY
ncbi:MAG: DUF1622 domain-containing protein [Methanotrichaceae archaeon]